MKTVLVTISLLFFGACTPVTERQKEVRQYRQVDWESRYLSYARRCSLAGGRMIIQASSRIARSGIPRRSDQYNCTRRVGEKPRD